MLNFFKNFFTHDYKTKLIAIVLAILTWWIFTNERRNVGYIITEVPVFYSAYNSNYVIVSDLINSVKITMQAGFNVEKTIDSFRIIVDLTDLQLGNNRYILSKQNFVGPQDKIITIEPNIITVKSDEKIVKQIPIKLSFTSILTPQEQNQVRLSQPEIAISGPKQLLDQLENVKSVPINLKQLFATKRLEVDFVLPKFSTLAEVTPIQVYID